MKNLTLRLAALPSLALLASAVPGCSWDEGVIIENMTGTVVLPPEAATRDFLDANGQVVTITDTRNIGPVYLGLYGSVKEGIEAYPYPEVGPQFTDGVAGDTYPYGGTTIGDIRYACEEFLACKFVSGRYATMDDLVDWFANTLQDPILDQFGTEVPTGDYLRQTCFDLLEVTSDAEILVPSADKNDDGKVDADDLDFTQRNDGMFEAEFTIYQQEWFDNAEQIARDGGSDADVHGFTLWGFMDAPGALNHDFTTCDPNEGYLETHYNNFYYGGRAYQDILNQPSFYIADGDWVSNGFVYENWYDAPELAIDIEVNK